MTPLVLLPGMMCDARLFRPQIKAFSGEREVITLPLIGADTVEGLAALILTQSPQRFALAGLSMGGIVAMQIAAQAPDRITHLALMDTNASPEHPKIAAMREPQIERVKQGALLSVMRDEMKPNYLADGPNRTVTLDLCMDMALTLGPDVFMDQSKALQTRPDMRPHLPSISQPTLVLCGAEDSLCPLHRHETIHAALPNSTLEVIQDAGHLPTLEKPAETTQAMRDWLTLKSR